MLKVADINTRSITAIEEDDTISEESTKTNGNKEASLEPTTIIKTEVCEDKSPVDIRLRKRRGLK